MGKIAWNKRTTDEIEKIVNDLGYVLLKDYNGKYQKKVIIQDEIGYKYDVQLANLSNRKPYFVAINNSFTLENISLWTNTNKLSFYLCEENIYKGKEHPLKFYCFGCSDIFYKSWNDIRNSSNCPICSRRRCGKNINLESYYPKAVSVWNYKENKKEPFEYMSSNNIDSISWICENNIHEPYIRTIHNSVRCNFRCPICSRGKRNSLLHNKVSDYLSRLGFVVLHEWGCNIVPVHPKNNRPMPYDNEVPELKLIVETHGEQHSKIGGWHKKLAKRNGKTPEEEFEYQKWRDAYKKKYAKKLGYEYLELYYYSDDEKESWKTLINNKINKILKKSQ